MADELIDIFDENMNLLGTALKSQAHREGLWHKTFHCWLARKNDEGRVMVWLQWHWEKVLMLFINQVNGTRMIILIRC
mgnify:CR=1 FL=1